MEGSPFTTTSLSCQNIVLFNIIRVLQVAGELILEVYLADSDSRLGPLELGSGGPNLVGGLAETLPRLCVGARAVLVVKAKVYMC
jgi:hypothetical protein